MVNCLIKEILVRLIRYKNSCVVSVSSVRPTSGHTEMKTFPPIVDIKPPADLPLKMVYFVCVLSLLAILLIGLILQHLDAFSSPRLILAGLSYRVQLPNLILGKQERQLTEFAPLNNSDK